MCIIPLFGNAPRLLGTLFSWTASLNTHNFCISLTVAPSIFYIQCTRLCERVFSNYVSQMLGAFITRLKLNTGMAD